jgi:enoyl-CoA hydratase
MPDKPAPDYKNIRTRTEDKVGLVQIDRPKEMNALNRETMAELLDALRRFETRDNIGCLVITGNERAFAAGADIKQMAGASVVQVMEMDFVEQWDQLATISKPLIAAVSGWCLGGGCELAMACDMIVASESARFGQPEIGVGIIPGAGGTQRLARAVGKAVAMEMVLANRQLTAQEAARYGLVNRVVPVERYLEETLRLAGQVAAQAPVAVRLAKEAINQAFETPLSQGLHLERRLLNILFATEDQQEGMDAFMEKRNPEWQGR